MPKADNPHIDTGPLGLALKIDSPKSKNNPHRSKWRVEFDTGIVMLVPGVMFENMQFHLRESD